MSERRSEDEKRRGLVLRGGAEVGTFACRDRDRELANELGWFMEDMPAGMRRGRWPTATEPGRYVWTDPAGGAIEMVYVPRGDFARMLESLAKRSEVWNYGAITEGFYANVFPTTVGEYRRFVRDAKHDAGTGWESPGWAQSDIHPVVNVSWDDARAYCEWAGLRLFMEGEWEYTARGGDGRAYPWGDETPLNSYDTRLWWNKSWELPLAGTAQVGTHARGISPFGLHDMSGNVWEWTESAHEDDPGALRVFRGGSWGGSFGDPSRVRAAFRGRQQIASRQPVYGFRCARGAR